ncbi:MAG: IS66 family transposase [Deltaproteobacteria bacterium]|nr:IS66 family transposase [Deltaproteobacteria bacterium]
MTRDEAAAILELPRRKAIDAILNLALKAEKFDQLSDTFGPNTPSGMMPTYLKPPGKKRKRKPGRKKGHPGASRPIPDKIDHFKEHTLSNCPTCENGLGPTINSYKRYTEDIPPVEPYVTEHTIHGYWCSVCKKTVYPPVTDALPNAVLGMRVIVFTAWLHYYIGVSISNIVKILSFSAQFKVSSGGLTLAWQKLAGTLEPFYKNIGQQIRHSAVLNADETGWRVSGATHWLWCFATKEYCYYVIDKTRGSPVIKRVLGKIFDGILICDFWSAYSKIRTLAKQRCFYHMFTELEKVDKKNSSPAWKKFRKRLTRLLKDAIRLSGKSEELPPDIYARKKECLKERLGSIIVGSGSDKDVTRLKKRLSKYRNELFTFLEFKDVSPYNNHAEQQMRKPVITRKISQQNRSKRGANTHAILMSLFKSAQLQGLNPIECVMSQAQNAIMANHKQKNALKLAV